MNVNECVVIVAIGEPFTVTLVALLVVVRPTVSVPLRAPLLNSFGLLTPNFCTSKTLVR